MLKMGNMKRILIFLMLLVSISLSAQDVAVKTNLLYDATTTINLGAEIGVAPKWTVDLSANYNGWTFNDNKKWKHWMAQPEVRYWFCERFNGHFLGAHLLGDIADLRVHIVEQAGKIGHNACRQDAFDPVGNGLENGFHSAVTVLSRSG